MARYCFYCGRELATGEKCNCRVHQAAGTAGPTGTTSGSSYDAGPDKASATKPSQTGTGPDRTQSSASSAGASAGSAGAAGSATGQTAPKSKAKSAQKPSAWAQFKARHVKAPHPKRSRGQGFNQGPKGTKRYKGAKGSGRGPSIDRAALLAGVLHFGRYLARPVEAIRQSVQYANTTRLLAFLLVHAALGGLTALMVSRQGTFDVLMQLTVVGSADNAVLESVFLFCQGVGLTLTLDLMLILITHLTLRYVFRAGFTFNRIATSFVPVIFYRALFMLLALFSLTTIPISSLLTLSAGMAVSSVALYLALRQLTNFEENRCFMLLAFIMLVFTSVLTMILSLAMPVIKVLLDQTLPL
ncbi:MAG: hypothetical protein H6Q62_411 [Firmicutes bacterium]|nr:hypothetical protein [Bacillota bacterium]